MEHPGHLPIALPQVRRISWRRVLGFLKLAVILAAIVVWFVALRPQALGGPAEYVMVAGTSMMPTLKTDDVVVVRPKANYNVGDVIAYRIPKGAPAAGGRVIHRIVGGANDRGYKVQGDNRKSADLWHPKNADVIGAVWVRLPHAARFARVLRSPLLVASLAAGLIFALVVGSGRRDDERPSA